MYEILINLPEVTVRLIWQYIGLNTNEIIFVIENLMSAEWNSNEENYLTLVGQNRQVKVEAFVSAPDEMGHYIAAYVFPSMRNGHGESGWISKAKDFTELAQTIAEQDNPKLRILFQPGTKIGAPALYDFQNSRNGFTVNMEYIYNKRMSCLNLYDIYDRWQIER